MALGFKWRLISIESLCNDIEESSKRLKNSVGKTDNLMKGVYSAFEEIKQIKPEFNKLHIQVAKLKEYNPKLQDMFHEQKEKLSEKTSHIFLDLGRIFTETEKSTTELKNIMLDADSILYKENQQLDKFTEKIKQLKDSTLSHELLIKINTAKEDMVSVARKLFESAKAEEKDILIETTKTTKQRIPLSEQIRSLSIQIEEVGKVLEHLNIDDIDDILKSAEKQIDYVEKIELDIILIIKKLEKYLIEIKNKLYLLDDKVASKVRIRLISCEKKFDKTKEGITKSAENLLKEITLIEK